MSFASFTNSFAFRKACDGVFKSVDKNGDGIADEVRLHIVMDTPWFLRGTVADLSNCRFLFFALCFHAVRRSQSELLVAMCKMHYKLAKKVPGVTDPPTGEQVQEKMKEYDIDMSGGLNQDEFYKFARKWFNQEGVIFIGRMILTAFVSMVVLPESAAVYVQRHYSALRASAFAVSWFWTAMLTRAFFSLPLVFYRELPSFRTEQDSAGYSGCETLAEEVIQGLVWRGIQVVGSSPSDTWRIVNTTNAVSNAASADTWRSTLHDHEVLQECCSAIYAGHLQCRCGFCTPLLPPW